MVGGGKITSFKGGKESFRTSPHRGVDIAAPYGTTVVAIESGFVLETGYGTERGYYIEYLTDSGLIVQYIHLKYRPKFKIGTCLAEGQKVGEVGSTGTKSKGYHLDIKIKELLGTQEFIDPWDIIGTSGIINKKGKIEFSLY